MPLCLIQHILKKNNLILIKMGYLELLFRSGAVIAIVFDPTHPEEEQPDSDKNGVFRIII